MSKSKKSRIVKDRRTMNAREAITSLIGFLTTRRRPLILSSRHDCAPVVEIIKAFEDFHHLPPVRDDAMIRATDLPQFDLYTNEPERVEKKVNDVGPTSTEVLKLVTREIYNLPSEREQNAVIGKLLAEFKLIRESRVREANDKKAFHTADESIAFDRLSEFNNILSGNFTVI